MTRFALLRGVNLGKRTVKSAELKRVFEAMGFDDVAPFLASGNVAFRAAEEDEAALCRRIEAGLRDGFGFDVTTFLRTCAEMAVAAAPERIEASPLAGEDGVTINVLFLAKEIPAELRDAALSLRTEEDDFLPHGRELYWLRRGRMSESPARVPLERAMAGEGTVRNLNTVRRLVAKFCS